jgi:endoglucanase
MTPARHESSLKHGLRRAAVLVTALAALLPLEGQPDGAAATEQVGSSAARNPFARARLYTDPGSPARRQAEAWRASRPEHAAQIEKIARQSTANWFGDWSTDVQREVRERVSGVRRAGALPVIVAYNIPQRDCGGQSSGGAPSARAYRRWIGSFAKGIGRRRAIVILEPDALAALDCLSPGARRARIGLIRYAVRALERRPGVAVYVDAGNSVWHPAPTMARRLAAAGATRAQGFALNVSNFLWTRGERAYGNAISKRLRGKHFVIDTSRNGRGPASGYEWCNPAGRALGRSPTVRTGHRRVDAYLWIKYPGESDGRCNGGPGAGTWWPEYALGLAQRAG